MRAWFQPDSFFHVHHDHTILRQDDMELDPVAK